MGLFGFRGVVWFIAVIVFIGGVLIGIISAGVHGAQTGNFQPLWENTAGMIAGADANIEQNMDELIERGETMDARELRFVKQDILTFLGVLAVLVWLVIISAKWSMGEGKWNAKWWFIWFAIAVVILFLLALFYNYSISKEWHMPLGVWKFITEGIFNERFWTLGQGFINPLDVGPPPEIVINETINITT